MDQGEPTDTILTIHIGPYRVVNAIYVAPFGDGIIADEIDPETTKRTGERFLLVDGRLFRYQAKCPVCGGAMMWLSTPLGRITNRRCSPGCRDYLPVFECDNPNCRKTVVAQPG